MQNAKHESQTPNTEGLDFTLIRGGPLFHSQRFAHLLTSDRDLCIRRRIFVLIAVTWLPMVIGAALQGQLFDADDPLLRHFGVHTRCLIAIPLFILAEGLAEKIAPLIASHFVTTGLVPPERLPQFRQTIAATVRLRDSRLAFLVIVAFSVASGLVPAITIGDEHETVWAVTPNGSLSIAGWWLTLVVKPIFALFLLGWVWRLVCLFWFFRGLTTLNLALAPTHPDGVGGLGFLEEGTRIFTPVLLGLSAVIASRLAHDVIYHGVRVETLQPMMMTYLVAIMVIFLAPWLAWIPLLARFRRQARLAYGALLIRYGQYVDRRWIRGEPVQDAEGLLSAPELGPVADIIALNGAVEGIRIMPLRKKGLIAFALPAALPLLGVFAIQVPIKDLLLKILGTLI